jgi:hypothetical protein
MKKVAFLLVMLMAFVFTNSQAANTNPKSKANTAKSVQKPEQKPTADAKKKPANTQATATAKPATTSKPAPTTKPAPAEKPAPAAKPAPVK